MRKLRHHAIMAQALILAFGLAGTSQARCHKRCVTGKRHCSVGRRHVPSLVVPTSGPFCDNPVGCPAEQSIIDGVFMFQERFGVDQARYYIQNNNNFDVMVYPAQIVKARSICQSQTCYQGYLLHPNEKQKVGEGNDVFTAAHDGVGWAIVHSRRN